MSQIVKDARLMARLSQKQKDLFQQAANYQGRTLTEFLLDAAQEKAERVIEQHEVIRLSEEDQKIFFAALLNPPPPNEALKKAFQLHKELIREVQ